MLRYVASFPTSGSTCMNPVSDSNGFLAVSCVPSSVHVVGSSASLRVSFLHFNGTEGLGEGEHSSAVGEEMRKRTLYNIVI